MRIIITMRELQKISAGAIQALPHPVPIKSGDETVAVLVPIRRASPELIASVSAKMDAAEARRTPEEQAAFNAFLEGLERD